jgi:ATP-dependent Clp protease ATP-binding subunit ClpA
MFERFTKRARTVVQEARAHAERSSGEVRPEHLLLALLEQRGCVATQVLASLGAPPDDLRAELERHIARYGDGLDEDDAEALAGIGIDLEQVTARIEVQLGGLHRRGGRVGFSRAGRKVLELSLREAMALQHHYIGTEHLLLGLARADDRIVADTLARWGLTRADLRLAVAEAVRRAG